MLPKWGARFDLLSWLLGVGVGIIIVVWLHYLGVT